MTILNTVHILKRASTETIYTDFEKFASSENYMRQGDGLKWQCSVIKRGTGGHSATGVPKMGSLGPGLGVPSYFSRQN